MADTHPEAPDSTAVRVALWRAMHVLVDPPPHVLEDEIGLQLAGPEDDWRDRPDMDPNATGQFRASIVARARFVEDRVAGQLARGVEQYVILGAGLDTFAQRRPDLGPRLQVFEVDPAGPQAWKRRRLAELGYDIPEWLHFVPADFEAGWRDGLANAGFDSSKPAVVASTGVSMYISKAATMTTLRQIAGLASGSTLAMTFLLPMDLVGTSAREGLRMSSEGARASGTPFISFFAPAEMLGLARDARFREAQHISADALAERYFADRPDGLRPPSNAEEFLVATT